MVSLTRDAFLLLSWEQQKATDFRKVLDPGADVNLTANCISHQDDTASMVIYENAVYCFGCRRRWWPDQFLKELGQRQLQTERGARKQPAPKYIPYAVAETFKNWLWGVKGHYADRQQWLLDRGLNREVCVENLIGHSGEAYTIPVYSALGHVQSIRYRRDDTLASEERPKYWGTAGANQAMLYFPHIPLSVKPDLRFGLILCEGELDALRLAQEGFTAASLTNGCNALKPEHLEQFAHKRVTVVYDQDDPGREAARRAYELLGQGGRIVRNIWWNRGSVGKDVTEWLQKPNGLEFFTAYLEKVWQSD